MDIVGWLAHRRRAIFGSVGSPAGHPHNTLMLLPPKLRAVGVQIVAIFGSPFHPSPVI
jgi:hypothetical protein